MAAPPKGPGPRRVDDDTFALRADARDPFALAAHAAARSPERDGPWADLERVAKREGRTEEAAAVYRSVLDRPYPADVAMRIASRAIAFHDEWIADAEAMLQLLLCLPHAQ